MIAKKETVEGEEKQVYILYMGRSAQDGENEQYLSLFLFFWSFTVAKRFDFLKFRQLF